MLAYLPVLLFVLVGLGFGHAAGRGQTLSRHRGRAVGRRAIEAPARRWQMNLTAAEVDAGGNTRRLKITEIFFSLQGEAHTVGFPTVFVRLTGCPLRCQYCDTAYAFYGGEWMTIDGVLARVAEFAPRYVCVTGGEPLAQKNCLPLLSGLCDASYQRVARNQSAPCRWRMWTRASFAWWTSRRRDRARSAATATTTSRCCEPRSRSSSSSATVPTTSGASDKVATLALAQTMHRAVLAQRGAIARARSCRVDTRRSPAGALPAPAAQGAVGQCPGEIGEKNR